MAHPGGRRPSAKLRALADCLRAAFGDPPYWEIFWSAAAHQDPAHRLPQQDEGEAAQDRHHRDRRYQGRVVGGHPREQPFRARSSPGRRCRPRAAGWPRRGGRRTGRRRRGRAASGGQGDGAERLEAGGAEVVGGLLLRAGRSRRAGSRRPGSRSARPRPGGRRRSVRQEGATPAVAHARPAAPSPRTGWGKKTGSRSAAAGRRAAAAPVEARRRPERAGGRRAARADDGDAERRSVREATLQLGRWCRSPGDRVRGRARCVQTRCGKRMIAGVGERGEDRR